MKVTSVLPQGSILGPHLLVGYADNTALLVRRSSEIEITWETETALRRLIVEKGLQITHEKTEAVLLNTRRNVRLQVGNLQIETKDWVRYLGVVFERNCHIVEHVNMVAVEAQKSAAALYRLMPNKGYSIRKVLRSVVHSLLLYATPIWQKAMVYKKNRKKLEHAERKVALQEVFMEMALVIMGRCPSRCK